MPDKLSPRSPVRSSSPRTFYHENRVDIFLLSIAGIALGVTWFKVPDAHNRLIAFPFDPTTRNVIDPSISYPYLPPIFDTLLVAILCVGIPIFTILLSQFTVKSVNICSSAILGLLYSVISGTLFQVGLKKLVGGLRPHFLDVCQPRPLSELRDHGLGSGFGQLYFTARDLCTGDINRINNALTSFPSGHSEIAFATMLYLSLYLFNFVDLQHFSSRNLRYPKMLMVVMPIFFAVYIAGAVVLGYHHFWYDALFGSVIGICAAITGFFMVFETSQDNPFRVIPRSRHQLREPELLYLD